MGGHQDPPDRRRKATAQNLRTEYETIALRDGEPIEDFAHRLNGIVQRLEVLGDPELETKVVAKYLRVARPRYKQLIISMESFVDISTLTIEEVTGTLRAADEVDTPPPPPSPQASGGKLLLTANHSGWTATSRRTATLAAEERAPAAGASAVASRAAGEERALLRGASTRAGPARTMNASAVAKRDTGPKIGAAN